MRDYHRERRKSEVYREQNRRNVTDWRERHPDYAKNYARSYRQLRPEQIRQSKRRDQQIRRARKRGALVDRVDHAVVFERDGGICGICGRQVDPDDWHLDHIQPFARGGEHSYANVRVACPPCNLSKHAQWDEAA